MSKQQSVFELCKKNTTNAFQLRNAFQSLRIAGAKSFADVKCHSKFLYHLIVTFAKFNRHDLFLWLMENYDVISSYVSLVLLNDAPFVYEAVYSPLMVAAYNGNIEMITALLNYGADPCRELEIFDPNFVGGSAVMDAFVSVHQAPVYRPEVLAALLV